MTRTTTPDLRIGDKIAYGGLVRTVQGHRADTSWRIGDRGPQRYQLFLAPLNPGDAPTVITTDWKATWLKVEGDEGTLVAFGEPVRGLRGPRFDDDEADRRADLEHMQRIGER